jgi:hypothetical protein
MHRLSTRAWQRITTQRRRSRTKQRRATHGALWQACRIVRVTSVVAKLVGLVALLKDRHIQRPRLTGPLRPDRMVLVLVASVGMHDHRELASMLQKPRHYEVVVADGNEDRPLATDERATFESRVLKVVVGDHAQVAVVIAAIAIGTKVLLECFALPERIANQYKQSPHTHGVYAPRPKGMPTVCLVG